MDETIETYERNGCTIKIFHDNDGADNPLSWTTPDERGATFALKHNRYDLPFEIDNAGDLDEYKNWTEFAESNAPSNQPLFKFVQWYEHSGISVSLRDEESTTDRFDAGIAGVIFGEDEDAIKGAFNDWKQYTEGEVYGFTLTDADGDDVDSMWGFYGLDYCKSEANEMADAYKTPRKPERTRASRLHF
jgi:hypothetical protein